MFNCGRTIATLAVLMAAVQPSAQRPGAKGPTMPRQAHQQASEQLLEQPPSLMHALPPTNRARDIFSAVDPLRAALARVRSMTSSARSAHPTPTNPRNGSVVDLVATLPPQPHVFPANGIVVVVAGFGHVGLTIVGELLRRGCTVRVFEAVPSVRDNAYVSMRQAMCGQVQDGLLLDADVELLMERFEVSATLGEAVVGARLVLEAIREDVETKRAFYTELTEACCAVGIRPEQIILGTNTLTVALKDMVQGMPEDWAARLIGLRMFYPTWFVDEVELTMGYTWCPYTGTPRGVAHPAFVASQPAYHEAEALLRRLLFRAIRYVGARRVIEPNDNEAYVQRQRGQCARALQPRSDTSDASSDETDTSVQDVMPVMEEAVQPRWTQEREPHCLQENLRPARNLGVFG